MVRRVMFAASLLLLLWFIAFARPFSPTAAAAQAASTQAAQQSSNMQDMMKMHEQMMTEMNAADARLDTLVKEMNAASGDAKVNAVAAVVTELVRQQRTMHQHMDQMHQQMMGGRGMMMKK